MSETHDPEAVNETICRQFESAWIQGLPRPIESFFGRVPGEAELATLEELVCIEMEFSWKNWSRDRQTAPAATTRPAPVETYWQRFPVLMRSDCRRRLIEEESSLRRRLGDPPSDAEFQARFPDLTMCAAGAEATRAPTSTPSQFRSGAVVSRLQLVERIGQGSFGVVWKAFDPHLGRHVAVKQLGEQHVDTADLRGRFQEEARIAARLEHPGIVPVYDLAQGAETEPYYVMKLVKGETFAELIHRYHTQEKYTPQKALAFQHLLNTLLNVARAVAYAHSHGVLHRDLKPTNVLVGTFGETVVLDWGLARSGQVTGTAGTPLTPVAKDLRGTLEGTIQGTPAYMAPEQAAGRTAHISERTDVYALGVMLYEITSGQLPFPADSAEDVLNKILSESPVPPRQISAETSRPLQAIALRALAKDPDKRYPSAQAFVQELERYLADEPVEAFREPWMTRLARWGRRHRTLVASATAALGITLLALMAGLIFLSRANARERHLRQVAENERQEADRQRERAERHYRMARESVETYLTKVGEDERLRSFGLERLRRDLLESARAFFDRFVAEEEDLAVRGERAIAYFKLSEIESGTGNSARALELAERGRRIFDVLLEESPANPAVIHSAMQGERQYAQLLGTTGRAEQAEEAFRQLLERCERALKERPDDAIVRQHLAAGMMQRGSIRQLNHDYERAAEDSAIACRELELLRTTEGDTDRILFLLRFALDLNGNSWLHRNDYARAKQRFELARKHLATLRKRKPNEPDLKLSEAQVLLHLAAAERMLNNADQGEKIYQEVRQLTKELVDEHPRVTAYRLALANTLNLLGQMAADKGQMALALEQFRMAIELLEPLIKLEPKDVLVRQGLTLAYLSRGRERSFTSQLAEALQDLDKALEYADAVQKVHIRSRRAMVLLKLGRHQDAAREAEDIAAAITTEPELRMTNARVLSQSARFLDADSAITAGDKAKRVADLKQKAVAALRELQAAGYFKSASNRETLQKDTWLDPLRELADFKSLLDKSANQ